MLKQYKICRGVLLYSSTIKAGVMYVYLVVWSILERFTGN